MTVEEAIAVFAEAMTEPCVDMCGVERQAAMKVALATMQERVEEES